MQRGNEDDGRSCHFLLSCSVIFEIFLGLSALLEVRVEAMNLSISNALVPFVVRTNSLGARIAQ